MCRLGQILNRAPLLVATIEALLLQQMVQRVALVLPELHGLFHAFHMLVKQSGCTADIHARGLRRRHEEARDRPRQERHEAAENTSAERHGSQAGCNATK